MTVDKLQRWPLPEIFLKHQKHFSEGTFNSLLKPFSRFYMRSKVQMFFGLIITYMLKSSILQIQVGASLYQQIKKQRNKNIEFAIQKMRVKLFYNIFQIYCRPPTSSFQIFFRRVASFFQSGLSLRGRRIKLEKYSNVDRELKFCYTIQLILNQRLFLNFLFF